MRPDIRYIYIALAAAIAMLLILQQDRVEGFFETDTGICDRVKAGSYPQISLEGVLDAETCAEIIKDSEAHALTVDGWETKRHDNYPTTDLDTAKIPSLVYPVHNIVYRKIVPKMAKAFKLNPLKLGISEVFVAKYAAERGKQRSLAAHVDGSDFSFVVALNDAFEGGGTKFVKTGRVKRPGVGSAVGFCGQSRHQGLAVTSGTRYILAGFLKYETPEGCEEKKAKKKKKA